jgi:hypothetical protein
MAVTCIEITIRYLLVRPLIQAAFLSEDWADLLTQRIMASRTADDRKLIQEILRFHANPSAGARAMADHPRDVQGPKCGRA